MSSRGKPVTRDIKAERRKVAEQMKKEYDTLTLEQKLARLPPPPAASKQRARLEAQMNKRSLAEVSSSQDSSEDNSNKKAKSKNKKTNS